MNVESTIFHPNVEESFPEISGVSSYQAFQRFAEEIAEIVCVYQIGHVLKDDHDHLVIHVVIFDPLPKSWKSDLKEDTEYLLDASIIALDAMFERVRKAKTKMLFEFWNL